MDTLLKDSVVPKAFVLAALVYIEGEWCQCMECKDEKSLNILILCLHNLKLLFKQEALYSHDGWVFYGVLKLEYQ